MAFVRILLMNLLFCGPLRVFFGVPAGAAFGFLFCAAGGHCAGGADGAGRRGRFGCGCRKSRTGMTGKRRGRQKCRSFCGTGGTFRWGETAPRAGALRPCGARGSGGKAAAGCRPGPAPFANWGECLPPGGAFCRLRQRRKT